MRRQRHMRRATAARGMRRVVLLGGAALGLLSACKTDTGSGPGAVQDAGVEEVGDVAPKGEICKASGPCRIELKSPEPGARLKGSLTFVGKADHAGLLMDKGRITVTCGETTKASADIPVSKWKDGSYSWTVDSATLGEGPCTATAVAETEPDGCIKKPVPLSCEATADFIIDNACPTLTLTEPKEGEVYHPSLPIDVLAADDSGIKSLTLTAPDGAEVWACKLTDDGFGEQHCTGRVDLSSYDTGTAAFTFKLVDRMDNECTPKVVTIMTVRKPGFVEAERTAVNVERDVLVDGPLPEGASPAEKIIPFELIDYPVRIPDLLPNDDYRDIVLGTDQGLAVAANDGKGKLKSPISLPDIDTAVARFMPDDLNGDGYTDFVVVSGTAEDTALAVWLYDGEICEKDPAVKPEELLTRDPVPESYPTRCHAGYVEVESHTLGFAVSAHVYGHLLGDPSADDPDSEKLKDVVVGFDDPVRTFGVLARVEGGNPDGGPACAYHRPKWGLDGTLLPLGETQKARCFNPPVLHNGNGKVSAITIGDFLVESGSKPKPELLASHGVTGQITTYRVLADGTVQTGESSKFGSPPQIAIGYFDNDPVTQYPDAMLLFPDSNEIDVLFGDGKGGFRTTFHRQTQSTRFIASASCVEGKPVQFALRLMDDYDSPSKTLDLVVLTQDDGTLWTMRGSYSTNGQLQFAPYDVVEVGKSPQRFILTHLEQPWAVADEAPPAEPWDAVVLNGKTTDAELVVAYGLDGAAAKGTPLAGPKGAFRAARSITTPIPAQPGGATHQCAEGDNLAVNFIEWVGGQAPGVGQVVPPSPQQNPFKLFYLGAPNVRLEPQLMTLGDANKDGLLDVTVVARQGPQKVSWATGQAKPPDPELPIITFGGDTGGLVGRYQPGSFGVGGVNPISLYRPATEICVGPSNCPAPVAGQPSITKTCPTDPVLPSYGPNKAASTDVTSVTKLDGGNDADLVIGTTTITTLPIDPKAPEPKLITSIDVIYGRGDGSFGPAHIQHPAPDPCAVGTPGGVWHAQGVTLAGERSRAVASISCTGPASESEAWISIYERAYTNGKTIGGVIAWKRNPTDPENLVHAWQDTFPGELPGSDMLRVGLLGPEGLGTSDAFMDIFIGQDNGVVVYAGKNAGPGSCDFERKQVAEIGSGLRSFAVHDFDGDGQAEIVGTLAAGYVRMTRGLGAGEFDSPFDVAQLPVEGTPSTTLGQVEAADINGDGFWDVLVLDPPNATLYAILAHGPMLFRTPTPVVVTIPTNVGADQFAVAPFGKADDCVDVVTLSSTAKSLAFLRSTPGGSGTCVKPK